MISEVKTKLFFSFAILLSTLLTLIPSNQALAQGVKVVVIDAGHGGVFPGAVYGGHKEKDINLKVALKLGEILRKGHPELKVILTRTKDMHFSTNLSEDLGARSKIANDASGDLFISIHANAAASPSAHGVETLIMGETSLEKQRNDAAIYRANEGEIMDMSDDKTAAIVRAYIQNIQFTYGQYSEAFARLIQKGYEDEGRHIRSLRRQPLMVLYGTDMPCALTEVGFMTNAKDLAFITSPKGIESIAKSIYNGIDAYIKMIKQTVGETVVTATRTDIKKGYTIQILSSKKILPERDRQFKSYVGQQWYRKTSGNLPYKYCIGKYRSKGEAEADLREIRRSFPDAFITAF